MSVDLVYYIAQTSLCVRAGSGKKSISASYDSLSLSVPSLPFNLYAFSVSGSPHIQLRGLGSCVLPSGSCPADKRFLMQFQTPVWQILQTTLDSLR